MANRYISLPEELNQRLKGEVNASALIQKLLHAHFYEEKPIEIHKQEIMEQTQKLTEQLNKLNEMTAAQLEADKQAKLNEEQESEARQVALGWDEEKRTRFKEEQLRKKGL